MAESPKFIKFTKYWPNRIDWPQTSYSQEKPKFHGGKLGEEILINVTKIYTVTKWQEPISFDPDPYKPNIKNRTPEICCALWQDASDEKCIIVHGNLNQVLVQLNG